MTKRIIFSDGGKGGVGKSFVSICLVDYLLKLGEEPGVIESDTANPDVGRIFNQHAHCTTLFYDLKQPEDWLQFTVSLEEYADHIESFVINLPAGIVNANCLQDSIGPFREMGYAITTLFTINRHIDSINLLGESLESGLLAHSDQRIVVLNGSYGQESSFARFEASEIRQRLLAMGGSVLYLPELFHVTCDLCLLEKNMTFSDVLKEPIQIAYRYQIMRWISNVHCRFDQVFCAGRNIKEGFVCAKATEEAVVE